MASSTSLHLGHISALTLWGAQLRPQALEAAGVAEPQQLRSLLGVEEEAAEVAEITARLALLELKQLVCPGCCCSLLQCTSRQISSPLASAAGHRRPSGPGEQLAARHTNLQVQAGMALC